jgi:hypothetical protein
MICGAEEKEDFNTCTAIVGLWAKEREREKLNFK